MKKLIIAEKPSVARDIAAIVGATVNDGKKIVGPSHDVTWCIGHLVSLAEAKAYGYERWDTASLPMLVEDFELEPNERTLSHAEVLSTLLNSSEYSQVINACDAGREGEAIFRRVYEWSGSTLPMLRLWISSLTPGEIKKGMEGLEMGSVYDNLANAAQCRSEADWLVGMNATRALTLGVRARNPSFEGALSVGRVQTPTLALIVDRHLEREHFVSKDYWELHSQFEFEGTTFGAKLFDDEGKTRRFDDKNVAGALHKDIAKAAATVIELTQKQKKRIAPQLFDLTTLQRVCNQRFGFSAMDTLGIAQALYERHKVLSYPRTDSKFITEEFAHTLKARLDVAAVALDVDVLDELCLTKRVVNTKGVNDHHAIVPTEQPVNLTALSLQERKVYELVVRRSIAACAPSATLSQTKVRVDVKGQVFGAQGTQVIDDGWMKWEGPSKKEGDDEPDEKIPSNLKKGDVPNIQDLVLKSLKTKAKPKLNEASLLGAMERASLETDDKQLKDALKGSGMGTPATRASIIETIIGRGYVSRDGKHLNPTSLGVQVVQMLRPIQHLTDAEMTARWELRLEHIAQGKLEPKVFMQSVRELVQEVVSFILTHTASFPSEEPFGHCPDCKQHSVYVGRKTASCSTQECSFRIWRSVGSNVVTAEQIEGLLAGKTVGPFTGIKSRDGEKTFDASLVLVADEQGHHKSKYVFETALDGATCPQCKSQSVMAGSKTLICSTPECDFRLWHAIAPTLMTRAQLLNVLVGKIVGPIKNIKSRDGKKTFDAQVKLRRNDEGKYGLSYVFETALEGSSCPECKAQSVLIHPKAITCSAKGCDFSLWRVVCGKTLNSNQLKKLLDSKTVGPLKGFQGKENKFDAKLKLEKAERGWRAGFVWGDK